MSALRQAPAAGRTTLAEQAGLDGRYDALAARERLLPIKVPAFFAAKVDEEVRVLGHTEGPLHRMVRPPRERLALDAGGEVPDWVDDRSNMPVTGSRTIIHKYPDRVLFMPTSTCAGHCQYCFRQDVLSEAHAGGRTSVGSELDKLVAYVESQPRVTEVLLSGGDPMTLPYRDLEVLLDRLRALPQLRSIRIHTRALTYAPKTFADPAKIALLARARVRLVLHFAHPYEICADIRDVLGRLDAAGLRLYNHFPLLRGVNDHVDVIARLIETLDEARVRTLSIYMPEPIRYSAPWRLSLKRFLAIEDELTTTTPGWINAVRFTLDSPIGKVRGEHIVAWDHAADRVTFERQGQRFVYPDFPEAMDRPGDRSVMLWKG
jgi:lysine 2,3-aminomutase